MNQLIDKLTELHGKATQGEWSNVYIEYIYAGEEPPSSSTHNDEELIIALHNSFPLIKQHFEAMERLVTEIENDLKRTDPYNEDLGTALADFRNAIK